MFVWSNPLKQLDTQKMPRTAPSRPAEQDETTGVRRITADRAFRNRRSDEQSAEDGPPVRAKRGLSLGVMVRFARSHALTVFPLTPPARPAAYTQERRSGSQQELEARGPARQAGHLDDM